MELQGQEAPHDFLSLYPKDSSFQQQDPRPPPSRGFSLETHDFLRPLEKAEKDRGAAWAVAAGGPIARTADRALPGAMGHVNNRGSRGAVKPERGACRVVGGFDAESKPESANGSFVPYGGVPFTLRGNSNPSATESRSQGQWQSPFAALGSLSSHSRHHPERKRLMETPSRSSRGFDDDDDEEEEDFAGKEAPSSSHKELTNKIDGTVSGSDQRPNTPRSKHSATEQRRRSKINDRFQILRELIPHSDQKRDKASFLLEVIEYIRFLQEKVPKHASGRNQDNAKLTPWKNSQSMGDDISDPARVIKTVSAPPGCLFSGRLHDNRIPSTPAVVSGAHSLTETDLLNGVSNRVLEPPPNFANVITPQPQAQWLRPSSVTDCTISNKILKEQGELTIDDGTISLSSSYSQELLTTLTVALRSSGVDLSRASMSVQINLGKRANSKSCSATAATCIPKDCTNPGSTNQAVGHSGGEQSPQVPKRRKSDNR
ncbi:transcription factor BIM2-like [Typha angustifolia]|uniref:transcription factor BIM2-like n=1 Tax=Typha angustifolia TaxID=59011 RepID=UPI003C2CB287